MGEGDATTPIRSLGVSISFGRFDNDLLSWEKWSSFSQNKYLEEVEKCATPGSVAEKKAFFEARNKLIAVRKAEILNKQMEVCQDLNEEKEVQNTPGSEVDQYDEEAIEENVFGSELSSLEMNEHPELETDVFVSQEPDEKGVVEEISINHSITSEPTILSKTSCHLVVDCSDKDSTMFIAESETPTKDHSDENILGSTYCQKAGKTVQNEPISNVELSGFETDQPSNMQRYVLRSAQTNGEKPVGNYIDALAESKEEIVLNNKLSPNSLDQLKLDDAWVHKSSSPIESEYVKSKNTDDIPALKTEHTNVEPKCDQVRSNISADKSVRTQKMKPHPLKSSDKILLAKKQDNGNVKKTPVSSVRRSPQTLTPKTLKPSTPTVKAAPKTLKPSTPTVKAASQSLPVSRVKNTAASAHVVPNSTQVPNATRSTSHFRALSLKPSSSSPSKKGVEVDSLTSRKKSISAGVSRKSTPTSLHLSLNFGSKVSGSVSGSTPITEPRKSLFMEEIGDKDIVKRAFRAFQYMSTPPKSDRIDRNGTPKQVVNNKTDRKPSTPLLQKEKDRLLTKRELDLKSKKPASTRKIHNLTLHSKEDRGKEELREIRTSKPATQPGLYKRQSLSKSFQDKDASKSEQRK